MNLNDQLCEVRCWLSIGVQVPVLVAVGPMDGPHLVFEMVTKLGSRPPTGLRKPRLPRSGALIECNRVSRIRNANRYSSLMLSGTLIWQNAKRRTWAWDRTSSGNAIVTPSHTSQETTLAREPAAPLRTAAEDPRTEKGETRPSVSNSLEELQPGNLPFHWASAPLQLDTGKDSGTVGG